MPFEIPYTNFKTNTNSLCPVDSRIIRSSYNPPTNILKICLKLLLEQSGYGCGLGTEDGLANVAMEKEWELHVYIHITVCK